MLRFDIFSYTIFPNWYIVNGIDTDYISLFHIQHLLDLCLVNQNTLPDYINYLLDIPQVVDIIKKCVLSSKTEIKKILNMAQRNDISVYAGNNIPIGEYGRKKRDQTST